MRTFLILLTLTSLAIAVTGCGGDDDEQQASAETTTSEATSGETSTTDQATLPQETTTGDKPAVETTERDLSDPERDQPSDNAGEADGNSSGGGASSGGKGSSAEQQAAAAAVDDFYRALVDGNGDRACALLTSPVRKQLEQAFAKSPQFKGKGCAEVIDTISANYPDTARRRLREIEITNVTVNGETATASYQAPGTPKATLPLAREGGSWKVGALTGAPGAP